jgi:O-antigen/teichoic acid export membrane protein
MGYTTKALKGLSFVMALRILMRGISFIRIAIIARVLTPGLFGLYGIASLVLSFVEILTEFGINIFIIQEKQDLRRIVNTAWVVSIFRGVIIFVLIFLSGSLVARFFNSPDAVTIIQLISLVPLVRGFINPSIIKYQKDLDFKGEFVFRGIVFTLESLLSIVFVVLLRDPGGIILGMIAGAFIEVFVSFIFVKPVPNFRFENWQVKKIVSSGKWITMGGIFNYLFHNGDNGVVGRMLGASSLGVYDAAYRISMLPITEIAETVSKVIFPVYTQISEDKKRLRRAVFRTISAVTIVSVPIGFIFFFFAETIVLIILGQAWIEAVPIVRILAIFSVVKIYQKTIFSVYLSVKKQKYNTIVMAVSFLGMILTIGPLIHSFGLIGAAYSIVFGISISMPFALYYLRLILK